MTEGELVIPEHVPEMQFEYHLA